MYIQHLILVNRSRYRKLLIKEIPGYITRGNATAERGKGPLAERARPANVAGGAHNSAASAGVVHGRRNRRTRRPWPRPQLVHSLPARPVDGRVPNRQRLGRRERDSANQRISALDTDGW